MGIVTTRYQLTPLADGFCFGEGPRWFEGLLWFSDMLGEAVHTVTLGGSMTTLPLPGHSPSGWDSAGRLTADRLNRRPGRAALRR
ncbi:gluconolactonase domain protein [Mycobacterium xenopi 3993]|nr:gluconolactonase domain protein [Mycobacterium xenopi 3993]